MNVDSVRLWVGSLRNRGSILGRGKIFYSLQRESRMSYPVGSLPLW
jgi:hypothetical protein